jgi:hypothetical protein
VNPTPDIPADSRLALPEGALRGPDGQPLEVPPEGALGLLALGWVGLRLWRDQRTGGGWAPATPMRKPDGAAEGAPDAIPTPSTEAVGAG